MDASVRYEPQPSYTEPKKEDEAEKFASAASAPPIENVVNEKATDKAPSPELGVANATSVEDPTPVGGQEQYPP